ncbi:MAG: alpha-ketoglutarate-dependent dioxygenase AlkB [Cytophagales bacterium]|nr:alpha-ketoglutarate-dependent dioxygenase AlkB [Cytophagales bacterium]
MELFDRPVNQEKNHLPQDGEVFYYGKVFLAEAADGYYESLLNEIAWQHDQAVIFGKTIQTKRKVAWYVEQPFSYRYSGTTKTALPWSATLRKIKSRIEEVSGETYNSCLLNLYHSGEEGMAWHSDGEVELKKNGAIGSVSLGAERKFAFKHKQTKERIDLWLEHGSLMVMKGTTQSHWLHRLPPTKKVLTPRVNLTFRQMLPVD